MYPQDPAELSARRGQLVSYSRRLLDDGLAVGSAGNMSVRHGGGSVLITPSGVPYRDMRPEQICEVGLDGTPIAAPATVSSETPMHLAIYAATDAGAVVHTHSPEVIALSSVFDELPAIHYAITGLGGPVRVAPYTRFGSDGLASAAVQALSSRRAAILQNHGAICYGRTLTEAYERALLLEWLAHTYRLARALGEPKILTDAQLEEVAAEARRRRYGEAPAQEHRAPSESGRGGSRPDRPDRDRGRAQRGHALAAVLGNDRYRGGAQQIFITGSFWFSATAMAAGIATIGALRADGGIAAMERAGSALRDGILAQAAARDLAVNYTGPVQMPYLTFAGDRDHALACEFAARAMRGGAFVHPRHNWFVSAAMTDADVALALAATDDAFAAVRRRLSGK